MERTSPTLQAVSAFIGPTVRNWRNIRAFRRVAQMNMTCLVCQRAGDMARLPDQMLARNVSLLSTRT